MYVNNNIALYQDRREQLMVNGRLDFNPLITTVEGVEKVTGWWLRMRILEQFRLSDDLIDGHRQGSVSN
jgi:hypothetical protein